MYRDIPEFALVMIIGQDEVSTKSFAKKYFKQEEMVNKEDLESKAEERLEARKLTVILLEDQKEQAYEIFIQLAKRHHCKPAAFILQTSPEEEEARRIEALTATLQKKGFKQIERVDCEQDDQHMTIRRIKLANNKREDHGPFDIIGDIHGCYKELYTLLEKLGYKVDEKAYKIEGMESRKVVFAGDLVDRGPEIVKVLKLVMGMVKEGRAYCVLGNHDGKLQRKLKGSKVQVVHGLEKTMEELEKEPEAFRQEVKDFLDTLVSHYVLDEGRLVVAHAGLKERLQGRESKTIRDLAMFGETTGRVDQFGLPVRLNWSENYEGDALVVYGHTPQRETKIIHNTINIDTGCVYGGKLTAFRYPERELVQVQAERTYYESARPF